MATPTILWYWVPSDGDDEDHPNAYPIKRAQKDVRLGDVRAVRTPVCSHVGLLSRCLALAVGCGRRRTGACGQSQRLHSSDMLMCRLPPYHSSTHTAPFLERSHACVCVLSLLSLSLSLSSCNSSAWAILHPLSGPASTCSLSPLATASMCFLPRLPTPSVCSLRFVHVLARALLHTRSARSAGCAHLASLCSSPTSTLHLSPSQTSPQPLPITAHHHHRPPPDVPAPGDVPLPL